MDSTTGTAVTSFTVRQMHPRLTPQTAKMRDKSMRVETAERDRHSWLERRVLVIIFEWTFVWEVIYWEKWWLYCSSLWQPVRCKLF